MKIHNTSTIILLVQNMYTHSDSLNVLKTIYYKFCFLIYYMRDSGKIR